MEHSGNCIANCPESPIDRSRCYDVLSTTKIKDFCAIKIWNILRWSRTGSSWHSWKASG